MEIIDVITFNGEYELFDLRYKILEEVVDKFIVVESPTTFSGNPKPWYFEKVRSKYPKARYYQNPEDYSSEEIELAMNSPNTQGADHWKREFMQKERIKQALDEKQVKGSDFVFIGDCDEIWNPKALSFLKAASRVEKLKLHVYTYYLNNYSDEEFWGTISGKWEWMKFKCLNHLRSNPPKKLNGKWGWHFTSLKDNLRQKLLDSYTPETYANQWVMDNLDSNVSERKDFLGRPFNFTIDESKWPDYLKQNKKKFKHLLYETTK